jgi:hypothetical protein
MLPVGAGLPRAGFSQLPDEVVRHIVRQLETRQLAHVCAVCEQWDRVCGAQTMWRERALRDHGAVELPPWCDDWRAAYRDAEFEAQLGDCLEVRDIYGLWVTARVVARLDPLRVLVQFEGWSDKWLLWLHRARDEALLRPLGTEQGECPGLGPSGPMTAEEFTAKCGACHARLAGLPAEQGERDDYASVWAPPTREGTERLPAMYHDPSPVISPLGIRLDATSDRKITVVLQGPAAAQAWRRCPHFLQPSRCTSYCQARITPADTTVQMRTLNN